jgi:hypothetical protein
MALWWMRMTIFLGLRILGELDVADCGLCAMGYLGFVSTLNVVIYSYLMHLWNVLNINGHIKIYSGVFMNRMRLFS